MTKIATETKIVHDDALNINRRVIAGQPIPPDLVAAYEAAGGQTDTEVNPAAPDPAPAFDIDGATVDELQAEADRLELAVEGTGKDGKVVKADLVKALKAHAEA